MGIDPNHNYRPTEEQLKAYARGLEEAKFDEQDKITNYQNFENIDADDPIQRAFARGYWDGTYINQPYSAQALDLIYTLESYNHRFILSIRPTFDLSAFQNWEKRLFKIESRKNIDIEFVPSNPYPPGPSDSVGTYIFSSNKFIDGSICIGVEADNIDLAIKAFLKKFEIDNRFIRKPAHL